MIFNNQQAEVDITGLDFFFGSTFVSKYNGEVTTIAPYETVQFSFKNEAVFLEKYSIEFDYFAQANSDGNGGKITWTSESYTEGDIPIYYGTLTFDNDTTQTIGVVNSVTWNNFMSTNNVTSSIVCSYIGGTNYTNCENITPTVNYCYDMCKGVQTCPFYILGDDFIFQTPPNPLSQVNFTYIDLPEEGLSLSEGDSYDFFSPSNQYSFSVSHSSNGYINMEIKNNSTSSVIYSTSIFVENETVNLKIIKESTGQHILLFGSRNWYYSILERRNIF